MTADVPAAARPDAIDRELAALEQKLATLVAHARALRAANAALRRDLAAAYDRTARSPSGWPRPASASMRCSRACRGARDAA